MLVPGAGELLAMLPQMTHNIANFMGRKPGIYGDRKVMEPELCFALARTHMDVRGLATFI
jgi:hypothetical protein